MQGLVRSELYRVALRTQTKILLLIMAGVQFLFYGAFTIAHIVRPADEDFIDALSITSVPDQGLTLVFFIGSILLVVFSASLIGSEYGWNTLRPLVARSPSRGLLLGAKWATVLVYVTLFIVVSVILTFAFATIATFIAGSDSEWNTSRAIDVVGIVVRCIWALLPISALAMCLALIARSNAAGIAFGIGYTFVEPLILALLGALSDVSIHKGSMMWNANRVFFYGTDDGPSLSGMLASATALGVWTAVFVGVSFWIFNRRDVTSG